MAVPTLFAASPTSIPAAVYEKVWIEEIIIAAPAPGGEATARVSLRKFRTTESGAEFSPEPAEKLEVDALLSGAEGDPDLAAAVGSLMAYIAKVGVAQGVIAPPAA